MARILILCNYTEGICGVWMRAKQEAIELEKAGHDVLIFSSNAVKGSNETAPAIDRIGKNIPIIRFPFKKLGGESFMKWDFDKKSISYPEIIIAHSYRHVHIHKALKLGKEVGAKVFLVTHAPFVEKRGLISRIIVKFYDTFIGPKILNEFDKVIAITKWEQPYLKKLRVRNDKLDYIPNGIPDELFKGKLKDGKGVLFLGRISPVKSIETLLEACKLLKVHPTIVGPIEEGYSLDANVSSPVYDLKKKIKLIDKHKVLVLPSIRESSPQVLLEAMARGKIVLSSDTKGAREIIEDRKNGFLFKVGDVGELATTLNYCLKGDLNYIRKNARKTAENFKWSKLMKKWGELIK